ncbi:MAG: hypothetical protein MZV64_72325 [Ignavibacteriales bacterium]|nr:hypothetical protein [Ignavibacteriales bacterium]
MLARQVDRLGRRRVLLACALGLPPGALVSAAAPSYAVFVVSQDRGAGPRRHPAHGVDGDDRRGAARASGCARSGHRRHRHDGGRRALSPRGVGAGRRARFVALGLGGDGCALRRAALAPARPARDRALARGGDRGETERARVAEVMAPRYRGRVIGVVGYVLLSTTARHRPRRLSLLPPRAGARLLAGLRHARAARGRHGGHVRLSARRARVRAPRPARHPRRRRAPLHRAARRVLPGAARAREPRGHRSRHPVRRRQPVRQRRHRRDPLVVDRASSPRACAAA